MCEYSGRLIAWLDHELPEAEAANVQWHVGRCAECRKAVASYREISEAFLDCYEKSTVRAPRRTRRWGWMALAVGAAAAILLALLLRPGPAEPLPLPRPIDVHAPAMAFIRPSTVAAVRRKHAPANRQVWMVEEPTVEVALPADALFPPGAVPAGFSFIATVRPQP